MAVWWEVAQRRVALSLVVFSIRIYKEKQEWTTV